MLVAAIVLVVLAVAALVVADRLPAPGRRLRGVYPVAVTVSALGCLVVEVVALVRGDSQAAVVAGVAGLLLGWAGRRRWEATRRHVEDLRVALHRLSARRRRRLGG